MGCDFPVFVSLLPASGCCDHPSSGHRAQFVSSPLQCHGSSHPTDEPPLSGHYRHCESPNLLQTIRALLVHMCALWHLHVGPCLSLSAVHAGCSCCSYARNLHSPVHCSACLCHHSGSKREQTRMEDLTWLLSVPYVVTVFPAPGRGDRPFSPGSRPILAGRQRAAAFSSGQHRRACYGLLLPADKVSVVRGRPCVAATAATDVSWTASM